MPNANLWRKSVPRAELDQRAREARMRLERVERLLAPRVRETGSWLWRLLCRCGLGLRRRSRANQTAGGPAAGRSARAPRSYPISGELDGFSGGVTGHAAIGLAALS